MEPSRYSYGADRDARSDPGRPTALAPVSAPHERKDEEDAIDLWAAAVAVWQRKLLVAATTATCAILAFVVSLALPKTYDATATVFVTPPTFTNELKPKPFSVEAYERLAKSDYIEALVAQQLRTKGILSPDEPFRLTTIIYPSREFQKPYLPLIGLEAQCRTPVQAQEVANAWASIFVGEQTRLAAVGKTGSVDFILSEFPKASATVLGQERKLKDVEEQQAKDLATARTRLAADLKRGQLEAREQILIGLDRQLSQIRTEIAESGQLKDQFEKELARVPQTIVVKKAITDDALWQSVVAGMQTGTPKPTDAKLESQEVNPVYVTVARRLAEERVRHDSLVPTEAAMVKQIQETRREVDQLRGESLASDLAIDNLRRQQRIDRAQTERDLDEARARFKKLEERIGEAQIAKAEQDSDVKVGALAERPTVPSSPKILLNVVMAAGLGFMLSLVGVWILTERQKAAVHPPHPLGAV